MTAAEPGGTKTYARARNRAAERRRRRHNDKMLARDKFMVRHIRRSFPGVNAPVLVWMRGAHGFAAAVAYWVLVKLIRRRERPCKAQKARQIGETYD
ncbi:MAG TPA: hypothetical protein VHU22_10135 [Xanthobacteraceae bacterium]|nr:hypothetical protein [Xanthobacteraceae bacterium]